MDARLGGQQFGNTTVSVLLILSGSAQPNVRRPMLAPRDQSLYVLRSLGQQKPVKKWCRLDQRPQFLAPQVKIGSILK
jgi:hypothetical protein